MKAASQTSVLKVKRAERQMLEELYSHMSGLQSFEKETLLDEEPEIMQRRAAVKQVLHALKSGFPPWLYHLLDARIQHGHSGLYFSK